MTNPTFAILFWSIAALMVLAVAGLFARALLGQRPEAPDPQDLGASSDLKVYRDQLRDIDRDVARGTLPADEAERLRTEVSRRILAADAKMQATAAPSAQPQGLTRIAAGLLVVAMLAGSGALYLSMGTPGYDDLPREARIAAAAETLRTRPTQAEIEARQPVVEAPLAEIPQDYRELIDKLREAVSERPDDLQGHVLLARYEAMLGNYAAARQAQERVILLKGDTAGAGDYADLADAMVLAAGGYVSPEAQAALDEALARDPNNGVALYYQGLMLAQVDRPDLAFRQWDALLKASPSNAPWVAPIRSQIEDLAWMAGVPSYTLPPLAEARGPSQADIDAAAEMSDADRRDMIQGMVSGLSERLATEGGPVEDWARLITALSVLGQTEQAAEIWTEAQGVFAEAPQALAMLAQAAQRAGLTE